MDQILELTPRLIPVIASLLQQVIATTLGHMEIFQQPKTDSLHNFLVINIFLTVAVLVVCEFEITTPADMVKTM